MSTVDTKTLSTTVSQNSNLSPRVIKIKLGNEENKGEKAKQTAPLRKFKVQKVENKVNETKDPNIANFNQKKIPNKYISPIPQIFNSEGVNFNEAQKRINEMKTIECNNSINYNNCIFTPNPMSNQLLNTIPPNTVLVPYNQNLYNYYWTSIINNKFHN